MNKIARIPKFFLGTGIAMRGFVPDDAASLRDGILNSNIADLVTRVPADYNFNHAMQWIIRCQTAELALQDGTAKRMDWAIDTVERHHASLHQVVIGSVSFINIDGHKAQLSYWLAKEYRGRHIMTDAVKRVVKFGLNECGFSRIWGATRDDNKASQRVLTGAGFVEEGIQHREWMKDGKLYDSRVYAIWK